MFFYEGRKPFAINRLDQVVGSAQLKTQRLVVHNGYHNDRNFGQLRFLFELVQNRPAVAVWHDNVQCDDARTNLSGQPQAFLSTAGSDDKFVRASSHWTRS